jgi:hypothetical protein
MAALIVPAPAQRTRATKTAAEKRKPELCRDAADGTSINDTGETGNEQEGAFSSLHPFFRIPTALLLAHEDNLADVVGIVSADMSNVGRPLLQLGFIRGLHNFF